VIEQRIRHTEVRLDIAIDHLRRKPGADREGLTEPPVQRGPSQPDRPNGADKLNGQKAPIGRDRRGEP
jgi:hypothetical protein